MEPLPGYGGPHLSNGATEPGRRTAGTGRLEAFSDGVCAIAITLELRLEPSGTALERVFAAWPVSLAYVVGFRTPVPPCLRTPA
jgi:hypothetical protein